MEFSCSNCKYKTNKKSNIKRHINNDTNCSQLNEERKIIEISSIVNCEYCNNSFNTVPSMKRHLITCKVKITRIEDENKKLTKELEKTVEALLQKSEIAPKLDTIYMYILQEREFINSKQHVYKIGKTKVIHNRMNGYPKGSKIICVMPVSGDPELHFLNVFRKLYISRADVGSEYFEGDIKLMIKSFTECCVENCIN